MRYALPFLIGLVVIAHDAAPAHAISACTDNQGAAPATGATLPVHPRIVHFTDYWRHGNTPVFSATINKKKVPVKVTVLPFGGTTRVAMIEIDSDKTGTLEVRELKYVFGTYTIKAKLKLPDKIPVAVERFHREIQHSTVEEIFDGIALRLPGGTPAIHARVKLRRDPKAGWTELDIPIATDADKLPRIRIGRLGCTNNYTVPLLAAGVDIEVTVTLADGSTRSVEGLPAHVILPPIQP